MSTEQTDASHPVDAIVLRSQWDADEKAKATAIVQQLSQMFGDNNITANLRHGVIVFCELSVPGHSVIGTGETKSEAAGRAALEMAERLGFTV